MLDKLARLVEKHVEKHSELVHQMDSPEIAADAPRLIALERERAALEPTVAVYQAYQHTAQAIQETQTLLRDTRDPGLAALAEEEIASLKETQVMLEEEIKAKLAPKEATDERDVIVEVRAAAGGDEAALFTAELYRMYTRYAQRQGWQVELIDARETGIGGFKEIVFEVMGKNVYHHMKHESGAHRVQRVPITESSGRIHTSTATVAVLPEAVDVEVDLKQDDLRIDIYHAGGKGGQNVNKVATAVRITHLPSNIVAVCQDERSQLRNKQKAMAVLKARLLDRLTMEQEQAISQDRRSQVGTGERSEKIRTYNFPQDRVTDHRTSVTLHNLPTILDGDLNPLIEPLMAQEIERRLEASIA